MYNWFKKVMNLDNSMSKQTVSDISALFDRFMQSRNIGDGRIRLYKKVKQILLDSVLTSGKTLSEITSEDLDSMYKLVIQGKSRNYACLIFKGLRTFFNWSLKQGIIDASPFTSYKIPSEIYGSPIYLTKDDIRKIMDTDLSAYPSLETQRDIFIFQCNIGCRVGDMMTLTKKDVINESVEYIPHKTINTSARTVRVPLNTIAKGIVERYWNNGDERLLPFISSRNYNIAIKRILTLSGVDYLVTKLDSVSGKEIKAAVNKIAGSHIARRTFVGNIYKQVRDPSLIASMTGHSEGSRAFSRYREIDIDIKREMVEMLEK